MSDFLAIFGDIYLPMSDLVRFPETYLIKDVWFWQRYLSQKQYICALFYLSRNAGVDYLSTPMNILIFVSTFKKKCSLYHKDACNSDWQKRFCFLLVLEKSDVHFSKTYLPALSYNVRFCLRYLSTYQKSDILYGRSPKRY